jgi:hypothetical protein
MDRQCHSESRHLIGSASGQQSLHDQMTNREREIEAQPSRVIRDDCALGQVLHDWALILQQLSDQRETVPEAITPTKFDDDHQKAQQNRTT